MWPAELHSPRRLSITPVSTTPALNPDGLALLGDNLVLDAVVDIRRHDMTGEQVVFALVRAPFYDRFRACFANSG